MQIRMERKQNCELFAKYIIRLEDEHAYPWRAKAKEDKDKLTDLAAARISRQIRPNQEANNYTKRKQTTWFAFFLLLLHTLKNVAKQPPPR